MLLVGGPCAAGGVTLAVLAPAWPSALAGFALVGLGASNIVPVLFSAVGRQHAMPANLAVGAVTTLGYAGILAGPAGIGFVAHAAGLPMAYEGLRPNEKFRAVSLGARPLIAAAATRST